MLKVDDKLTLEEARAKVLVWPSVNWYNQKEIQKQSDKNADSASCIGYKRVSGFSVGAGRSSGKFLM